MTSCNSLLCRIKDYERALHQSNFSHGIFHDDLRYVCIEPRMMRLGENHIKPWKKGEKRNENKRVLLRLTFLNIYLLVPRYIYMYKTKSNWKRYDGIFQLACEGMSKVYFFDKRTGRLLPGQYGYHTFEGKGEDSVFVSSIPVCLGDGENGSKQIVLFSLIYLNLL